MATVSVRYIVDDVDAAIGFYCGFLGFHEDMHPAPAFAMLSRGDLRHPDTILTDPGLNNTLDLSQPVAVLLVAILHFLPDAEQAYTAVRTLMNAVAPGSYLVLSHATYDLLHPETADALTTRNLPSLGDFTPRTRQQIAHFFDGFDLLPPGLEIVSAWRPEPGDKLPPPANVSVYGAVAHKPASCTGASC